MKARNLYVIAKIGNTGHGEYEFTDWYDFADWLRQKTLDRKEEVTIITWFYREKRI